MHLVGVVCTIFGIILVPVSAFVAILPLGIFVAPIGFGAAGVSFFLGRVLRKRARFNALNRRAGN